MTFDFKLDNPKARHNQLPLQYHFEFLIIVMQRSYFKQIIVLTNK